MRNVYQHAENCGKTGSLHPTRCNWNEKSELTCEMFYQKCGQPGGTNAGGGIQTHLNVLGTLKAFKPKDPRDSGFSRL